MGECWSTEIMVWIILSQRHSTEESDEGQGFCTELLLCRVLSLNSHIEGHQSLVRLVLATVSRPSYAWTIHGGEG